MDGRAAAVFSASASLGSALRAGDAVRHCNTQRGCSRTRECNDSNGAAFGASLAARVFGAIPPIQGGDSCASQQAHASKSQAPADVACHPLSLAIAMVGRLVVFV